MRGGSTRAAPRAGCGSSREITADPGFSSLEYFSPSLLDITGWKKGDFTILVHMPSFFPSHFILEFMLSFKAQTLPNLSQRVTGTLGFGCSLVLGRRFASGVFAGALC